MYQNAFFSIWPLPASLPWLSGYPVWISFSRSPPSTYTFQYWRNIDLFCLNPYMLVFPLFKVKVPAQPCCCLFLSIKECVRGSGQADRKWEKKLDIYCSCSEERWRGPDLGRCHWEWQKEDRPIRYISQLELGYRRKKIIFEVLT